MIIFLYGEDTYRSYNKLTQIKKKFKEKDPSGLNLDVLDGDEAEFSEIKKAIETIPFLTKKRLIILKNILKEGSKDLKNEIADFIEKENLPSFSIIVFWEAGEPDRRDRLFKVIKQRSKSENFELLFGYHLENWIKNEVKTRGGVITSQAVNKLSAYVGNNLWQMSNEIEKLILYASQRSQDGRVEIISDDVELLVKAKLETNIFNFIDALGAKNKKLGLKLLHDQIALGQNEIYLLAMITYQFRNMILVSEALNRTKNQYQIAKELNLHPYVVKKTVGQIRNFNLRQLKNIYQKLLEIDIWLKRKRIDPKLSLDLLVTELCQ